METKSVIISKEYLEKIKGFSAIRPDETFVYIPIAYRELPEDLQAKFTCRPVSGEDAAKMSDMMRGEITFEDKKTIVKTHRGAFISAVCRKGLVSWSNYFDGEGKIVEFTGNIDNLPYKLLEELASVIVGKSSLSEEELLGLK